MRLFLFSCDHSHKQKLSLTKTSRRSQSKTVDHRLCVCASGSLMMVILPCFKSIRVSFRHLGQNRGKCFNSVSFRIFTLVFPPQVGQITHSIIIPITLEAQYSPGKLPCYKLRSHYLLQAFHICFECDCRAFFRLCTIL